MSAVNADPAAHDDRSRAQRRAARYKPTVAMIARRDAELASRAVEQARVLEELSGRLLTLDQLADLPAPTPLISGTIDVDSLSILYGPRGTFKSFVVLDMVMCVASGLPWHGRDVRQCTVIYVVAEGVSGVHQRADAWRSLHTSADPGDRVLILPEAVNLLNASAVAAFATIAADRHAGFIVFDTLARCMVGGDENSAKDTGMAVGSLDLIRRLTGAHVAVVHHAGKDGGRGARGSSALEAAADSVFEVGAADMVVTMRTTKQKNRAEGHPISFKAEPSRRSIVLTPHRVSQEVSPKMYLALEALHEIAGDVGATMTDWTKAAAELEVSSTTVKRTRILALDRDWISDGPSSTPKSPKYVVSEAGRAIVNSRAEHAVSRADAQ